jgi:hypothetical protein
MIDTKKTDTKIPVAFSGLGRLPGVETNEPANFDDFC